MTALKKQYSITVKAWSLSHTAWVWVSTSFLTNVKHETSSVCDGFLICNMEIMVVYFTELLGIFENTASTK